VAFVLLPHIYLACCFISLSSIYLVLSLRSLWCACVVCRDYIDTLGNLVEAPHQVWFVLELIEGIHILSVLSV
jgi:hypothetical protein